MLFSHYDYTQVIIYTLSLCVFLYSFSDKGTYDGAQWVEDRHLHTYTKLTTIHYLFYEFLCKIHFSLSSSIYISDSIYQACMTIGLPAGEVGLWSIRSHTYSLQRLVEFFRISNNSHLNISIDFVQRYYLTNLLIMVLVATLYGFPTSCFITPLHAFSVT